MRSAPDQAARHATARPETARPDVRRRVRRAGLPALLVVFALVAAACGSSEPSGSADGGETGPDVSEDVATADSGDGRESDEPGDSQDDGADDQPSSRLPAPDAPSVGLGGRGEALSAAPSVPTGPIDAEVAADLDTIAQAWIDDEEPDPAVIERLGAADDARIGWMIADLLLVRPRGAKTIPGLRDAFMALTGAEIDRPRTWSSVVDHLTAWDLPAPDEYFDWKKRVYLQIDDRWEPFFADPEADLDWRQIAWGGVFLDERVDGHGTNCTERCIPSLDDPGLVSGADGDWLRDDRIVFGVEVNGEARAYPKHIMEVHEMVNDDLGGHRIGIPYCTLCGSVHAYLTDDVPADIETPVLRTSGLLTRSNKIMYDLVTDSIFNTFTGRAVSGPLWEKEFTLTQVPCITTTWGDWRAAHPDTTIVAHDGGVGISYPLAPLGERDNNGPIFSVGDVDPRLDIMELVLGAIGEDGVAVAFPLEAAEAELSAGGSVEAEGIIVVADSGGVRAELPDGTTLASHQSFWFAWSQFNPDTQIWEP